MQALSSASSSSLVLPELPQRTNQGATVDSASAKPVATQTQQAVAATAAPSNAAQVKESVQKVNDMVKAMGRGLEFSVDQDTHIPVVKITDTQTHEVIRQIPTEQVLEIAKALDNLQGLLIKDKV